MFEKQRGRSQAALIDDPLTAKGVALWLERVLGWYGENGGVDVEVIEDQVILNARSVEFLYSDFTPLKIRYVAGSRPMLEQVVAQAIRTEMSEREKALSILRRVRDNRDHGLRRPDLFTGGDEEDLLKRGAMMCNEVARLFACLCQVAGLPARLMGSHISGHMMNEVYVEGRWWWVDAMKGIAPVDGENRPVSTWQLMQDPKLFERQPASVWDEIRHPGQLFEQDERSKKHRAFAMARNRDCYFHPKEAIALGNYFVWEHARYTYPWRIEKHDAERLEKARQGEMLNRKALGWPLFYYHHHLFDDAIGPR
jgi:hypothetical protein